MSDLEPRDEDPRPLLTLASTPERVHDALTLLDAEAPAPLSPAKHHALFRAAADRVHGRRRAPRLVQGLAFAAACGLGVAATAALFERLKPAPLPPEITAAARAVYTLEGRTLTIVSGHVGVAARSPLTVRAGGTEFVMQAARAAFDVSEQGPTVFVESGEVVRRDGEARRVLRAGERLEPAPSGPLELELHELPRFPPAPPSANGASRADGDGLEAETALYELALGALDRGDPATALARFAEHQRRFPEGVLAPEASLGLMLAHNAQGDRAAVAAEARRFISRFPSDPRVARVRAVAH